MRTLFFGAGPIGSVYAHLLHERGCDVTILARGTRYAWLEEHGLVLQNEMTGQRHVSRVPLVPELKPEDSYDLVIVSVRKTRLDSVFACLAACPGIAHILFMGNNALGFDAYLSGLPAEKVLFGFPGAGGGLREQVVYYADREKPKAKRKPVTLGEPDGVTLERTVAIKALFESAGVPVDLCPDIDGWLKYHAALVSPLVGALCAHDCDPNRAAKDKATLRALVRAAGEGGRVIRALGYKRMPLRLRLLSWLPEAVSTRALKGLLQSRFAEVAFAMHAGAARDEMGALASELRALAEKTSIETPNTDWLRSLTV